MTPLLSLSGIGKRFGATVALADVSLDLPAGSVQAIVGHNGAGKSTLMRVLNGEVEPDSGDVEIDGRPVRIANPAVAAELGIGVVHQETTLCPHFTVLQNMFVGHERSRLGLLDWRRMRADAAQLLDVLGLAHVRDVRAGSLDVAHQQLTDIAKTLLANPRILILDEPNSALSESESDELFARMRTLRERGHLIIYISHRLREVRQIADDIVVMRDGRVAARVGPEATVAELAELLIGEQQPDARPAAAARPEHAPVPESRNGGEARPALAVAGWTDAARAFEDVDLEVARGEVVGIGGVEGSGHRELVRSLGGLRRARGRLELDGVVLRRHDIGSLLGRGVGYLSPDRGSKSLFQALSVERNLGVGVMGSWSRYGFLQPRRLRGLAGDQVEAYGIKGRPELPVRTLSGGNQQKVALARLVATNPRVVLLEEPTRGVDLGAKAEIYAILRELRAGGTTIVITSPELDELVELCDRVLVLAGGRARAELSGAELTETRLLEVAAADVAACVTTTEREVPG